jgi:hypothetical protein
LTPRTMLVPPSRLGPPESPKQVLPLLECNLMNSSLMELLLAISVVAAKKRVGRHRAAACTDRRTDRRR